jgi:hypothetical protein
VVEGRLTATRVLALVLALAAIVSLWAGRRIVFIADEWGWITDALHVTPNTILQDYYGHLFAFTHGAYVVLLDTVGLAHYWVFRLLAVSLHLTVALLVFLVTRRSVGPWLALAPAAVVAFLGTGADAFVSAINIGLLAATAACLGALLMLSRHNLRGDLATCGLLVIGLASFTTAVAFTAGVFVEILWQRDRWRRIWVALIPTLLYVAWRLHWGEALSGDVGSGGHQSVDLADLVKNSLKAATGAIAGLVGVQLENPTLRSHLPWLAPLFQVVVVAGAGVLALVATRAQRVSARFANVVVAGLGIWVLIAVGRGSKGDLYASRYVYAGAVVAALIIVEALSAYGMPGPSLRRLIALGAVTSIALNLVWMIVLANHIRDESTMVRARLAALDIAGAQVPSSFVPSGEFAFRHITSGSYFAAVRKFDSSPAFTTAELRRSSEQVRQAADDVLVRALSLRLVPGRVQARDPPPAVDGVSGGRVSAQGSCLTLTPEARTAVADLVPRSPSGVVLEHSPGVQPVVEARRFGSRYLRLPAVARAGTESLATPAGNARDPWHLRVVSPGPTLVCSRTAPGD